MRDDALEYLRRGLCPIPIHAAKGGGCTCGKADCDSPGKHPTVATWREYQTRLPTSDEVVTWWKEWPWANVGIITGKVSGIVVLDLDGKAGADSAKAQGPMPPTPIVATGGGGWHVYFTHPGGDVRNFVRKLPGLDLRGDGGLVVAPPSVHASGERYEWRVPLEYADLEYPPAWIIDLIGKKKDEEKPRNEKGWVERALAGVADGERNTYASKLAGYYLYRGLSTAEVVATLTAWDAKNKPPLGTDTVKKTVLSIAQRIADEAVNERNFEVDRIQKIETKPPIYYVTLFDRTVKLSGADLVSWTKFQLAIGQAINKVPTMRDARKQWVHYLNECLDSRLDITIAPEAASEEEVTWHHVVKYLEGKQSPDETRVAEKQGVYANEKFLYFHGPTLHAYLGTRGLKVAPADLWDVLRMHGASHGKRVFKKKNGDEVDMKVWWLEKFTGGVV